MPTDKPKLLWHSNAPHSPTGYGTQTALFTPKLAEHYDIGVSAFYGVEGAPIRYGDIPVYPGIGQTHGDETIQDHARMHFQRDLRGGLVFTLMDVWVLNPRVWGTLNVANWVPIDHDPCPAPVADYLRIAASVPVAMSRFGERLLQDQELNPLYVPHGVDTEIFRPIPKDQAREYVKLPKDVFICGMVAANKGNPSRKAFAENLQAFKDLHDRHDDAFLYLHTELQGRFGGVNLPELLDNLGIDRARVVFADQYRVTHWPFSLQQLAHIYSSLDVLLAASCGEGFGIPCVEAQACGVPVILSDFSASAELCGAGWKVKGSRFYTPLGAWQFHPDPDDIAEALRQAYMLPEGTREQLRQQARAFALDYDVDRVLEDHMLPALEEARGRFINREAMELVT